MYKCLPKTQHVTTDLFEIEPAAGNLSINDYFMIQQLPTGESGI